MRVIAPSPDDERQLRVNSWRAQNTLQFCTNNGQVNREICQELYDKKRKRVASEHPMLHPERNHCKCPSYDDCSRAPLTSQLPTPRMASMKSSKGLCLNSELESHRSPLRLNNRLLSSQTAVAKDVERMGKLSLQVIASKFMMTASKTSTRRYQTL